MEKFAYKIEEMLEKKHRFYSELSEVLQKEKTHIADMDIDSLWKSAAEKKEIASKIETVRADILRLLETRSVVPDMDVHTFSLSWVFKILPVLPAVRSRLRKVKTAIDTVKNEVSELAVENEKYVKEYLAVIDDIFSTVTDKVREDQYNNSGSVPGSRNGSYLINAEV